MARFQIENITFHARVSPKKYESKDMDEKAAFVLAVEKMKDMMNDGWEIHNIFNSDLYKGFTMKITSKDDTVCFTDVRVKKY